MTRKSLLLNACWLLALSSAFLLSQGDLSPGQLNGALDAGNNPQPSMKTLQEIYDLVQGKGGGPGGIDLATVAGSPGYHHHITNPGSYYLSSNLEVTLLAGIRIQAAGVTLNLNGFEIRRTAGGAQFGHAVQVDQLSSRCTIMNGSLAGGTLGFQYGVNCVASGFPFAYARAGSISDVSASGCTNTGLLAGEGWKITNSTAHDNIGNGIVAQAGSVLKCCVVYNNQGTYGIYANDGSSISDCTVYSSQNKYGIRAGDGSAVTGCSARDNNPAASPSYGVFAGSGSTLSNCTASSNTFTGGGDGYGIFAGSGSTLLNCSAIGNQTSGLNGYGIGTDESCTLTNCSGSGNTHSGNFIGAGIKTLAGCSLHNCAANDNNHTSNTGYGFLSVGCSLKDCSASSNSSTGAASYGIFVGNEGSVIDCRVTNNDNSAQSPDFNQGVGIWADNNSTVRGCTVCSNAGSGIFVQQSCRVTDNLCSDNGNAGVHVVLDRNYVANNFATGNETGILVSILDGSSTVVNNTATGNTTGFDINDGNDAAPIFDPGSVFAFPPPVGFDPCTVTPWSNFGDPLALP